MNKVIKIAIFFFASNSLFATPSWFGAIKPQNSYELVGFGEGGSLDEAKTNARADIAKQISVKISSEIKINKQISNEKYTKNSSSNMSEKSNVLMNDVKELNSQNENGVWFVALGYDNLSATTKLAKKLINEKCDKTPHIYLSNTIFYKNLAIESNIANCVMPSFDNGVNYIGIGDKRVAFDFEELLAPSSNGVVVKSNKTNIKNNESFHLNITAPNGFVSIFNIYDGGKVAVVASNIELKNDMEFVFPEAKSDFELSSIITEDKAIEGYFVISSAKKIDFSRFGMTSFAINNSEKYRFNEFLELLENNKFGSTLVNISK